MESKRALRAILWLVAIACVAFIGLQLIRPRLVNPEVTADLQAPAEIKTLLRNSCYNCHSNETKLSWFDQPVPAYWIVVRDVNEGRKHLNFSEIGKLPLPQQRGILFESVSQIELGAMPLPAYKRAHADSVVTAERMDMLKKYLAAGFALSAATPAEISAADTQYNSWVQRGSAARTVQPAPNGIEFPADYKNWKTISSTDRLDNGTIREILGNDIAVKAIANKQINPWPDGTAFAKIAWYQMADDKGFVRPGAFFQVEFMIRDSRAYAGTLGWGWARWRSADLKPYGLNARFTDECVGCHMPMRNANYVFTEPIGDSQ